MAVRSCEGAAGSVMTSDHSATCALIRASAKYARRRLRCDDDRMAKDEVAEEVVQQQQQSRVLCRALLHQHQQICTRVRRPVRQRVCCGS